MTVFVILVDRLGFTVVIRFSKLQVVELYLKESYVCLLFIKTRLVLPMFGSTMAVKMFRFFLLFYSLCLLTHQNRSNLPLRISSSSVNSHECSSLGGVSQAKQVVASTLDEHYPLPYCEGSGWTRVAYLNMTDPAATCPSNLTLHTSPVRGCGQTNPAWDSCDSVFYPVSVPYSNVCGQLLAYQKGATDAFVDAINYPTHSLETSYVDGVSMTYGVRDSRHHIWTFAAAAYEQDSSYLQKINCPCTNTQHGFSHSIPVYLENSYFCDTGNAGPGQNESIYYTGNPLWDGQGCGPHNSCCQFNSPPWFQRELPHMITDNIEMRVCFTGDRANEDVLIYLVELYIR